MKTDNMECQKIDTVVIGNGPVGIFLSYLLDGNIPFYNIENPVSNPYLHSRLANHSDISIIEQDFEELSQGLEGRSWNPSSLLFDALNHPDAELGVDRQSALLWRRLHSHTPVDHVVLGKYLPGGSWQKMEGDMQTLSVGSWLELPEMPFRSWLWGSDDRKQLWVGNERATISQVRSYYMNYVKEKGLQKYMQNYSTVTSLLRLPCSVRSCDLESGEDIGLGTSSIFDDQGSTKRACRCEQLLEGGYRWQVRGLQLSRKKNERAERITRAASGTYNHARAGALSNSTGISLGTIEQQQSSFIRSASHGDLPARLFDSSLSAADKELGIDEQCLPPQVDEFSRSYGETRGKDCNQQQKDRTESDEVIGWDSSKCHCGSTQSCSMCYCTLPADDAAQERANSFAYVPFCYLARNVVLATGTFDQAKKLAVAGEHYPYVIHSLGRLERAFERGLITPKSDPLVIIGCGLSAADALLYAMEREIPVIHVFRNSARDRRLAISQLPRKLYPDYHRVLSIMRNPTHVNGYQAFPKHRVTEFLEDGQILLEDLDSGRTTVIQSTLALVQIGFLPDLSFINDASGLASHRDKPISCNQNPIQINTFTGECTAEEGLYAVGSLVGENFIRFGLGTSLAVAKRLLGGISQ